MRKVDYFLDHTSLYETSGLVFTIFVKGFGLPFTGGKFA